MRKVLAALILLLCASGGAFAAALSGSGDVGTTFTGSAFTAPIDPQAPPVVPASATAPYIPQATAAPGGVARGSTTFQPSDYGPITITYGGLPPVNAPVEPQHWNNGPVNWPYNTLPQALASGAGTTSSVLSVAAAGDGDGDGDNGNGNGDDGDGTLPVPSAPEWVSLIAGFVVIGLRLRRDRRTALRSGRRAAAV